MNNVIPAAWVFTDIGNSATKFALAESLESDLIEFDRVEHDDVEFSKFTLPGDFDDRPRHWVTCSVNKRRLKALQEWLRKNRPGDRLSQIDNKSIKLVVIPEPLESVGTDRLVAAAGAMELYARNNQQSLVVVDVGTAITVDVVDADGRFLGGSIRPGIELQRSALHRYTDALPDLSESPVALPDRVIGTSTEDAILSGTGFGDLGAIQALVQLMEDQLEGPSTIVITGGGSNWMIDFIPDDWHHEPDLVLMGIQIVARQVLGD